MTAKATAVQRPMHEAPTLTALQQFEHDLQARYPNRVIQRFEFPSTVKQASACYLLELTSRDELEAAKMADTLMQPIERKSVKLSSDAEHREKIRISLVGLVAKDGRSYKHVNRDGVPFMEIDTWPAKATTALNFFYNALNSAPLDEILEGLKASRIIGAAATPDPTSAIPQSDST